MKTEVDEKELNLADTIAQIERAYGKGAVMMLGAKTFAPVEYVPTSSLSLDVALGVGGIPRGRTIEIFGPECITGDSFIQYTVRDGGRISNHKGGTIERLYERFHGIPPSGDGRGKYPRPVTESAEFFAPSVNEKKRIVQNKILDVVDAGFKLCFKLTTASGESITASDEELFLTDNGYTSLSKLRVGTVLYIHNNTPFRVAQLKDSNRARCFLYVKHHPIAGIKICGGYTYHRLRRARAVVEAKMNGMFFEDYIARLNSGCLDGLVFLTRDQQVHHRDENETNDNLDNLEVLTATPHSRKHATDRHNNLRFVCVADTVLTIENVGRKRTYDLVMAEPYRNYIANRFAVHNSGGKTTLALHIIAEAQKLGGQAAFVDAEHALDPVYARKLGVDVDHLLVSQPDNGEQALEITEALITSGKVQIVVVDSVAALVPKAELEGDMGDPQMGLQARLMSQALRKLTGITNQKKVILIFINQIREKIGVMFGSPETTTGGRALKFYASVRLDVRKTQLVKDGDKTVGADTRIKVVKNKCASPFREAEVRLMYGEGISHEFDLLKLGVEHGVVTKAGSHLSYGTTKLGQGLDNARVFLKENASVSQEIEVELRHILFPEVK